MREFSRAEQVRQLNRRHPLHQAALQHLLEIEEMTGIPQVSERLHAVDLLQWSIDQEQNADWQGELMRLMLEKEKWTPEQTTQYLMMSQESNPTDLEELLQQLQTPEDAAQEILNVVEHLRMMDPENPYEPPPVA